jgi:hypothetical protein
MRGKGEGNRAGEGARVRPGAIPYNSAIRRAPGSTTPAALAVYADQRDDKEAEAWFAEIKARACFRIGELSLELPTQQGNFVRAIEQPI